MRKSIGAAFLVIFLLVSVSSEVLGQSPILAPCINEDTRDCGFNNVGECQRGERTCINGVWSECEGAIEPVEEICDDGFDNDCNGLVDDCGSNTISYILVGSGVMLLFVALILSKLGK